MENYIYILFIIYIASYYYKLFKGYNSKEALNPLFYKSKYSELINILEEVKNDEFNINRDKLYSKNKSVKYKDLFGKAIYKNIITEKKYYLTKGGFFSDSFESKNEIFNFDNDNSKFNNECYFIVYYKNSIYTSYEFLHTFYEFNSEEFFSIMEDTDTLFRFSEHPFNLSFFLKNVNYQKRDLKSKSFFWKYINSKSDYKIYHLNNVNLSTLLKF